jgi:hypothetical protein
MSNGGSLRWMMASNSPRLVSRLGGAVPVLLSPVRVMRATLAVTTPCSTAMSFCSKA